MLTEKKMGKTARDKTVQRLVKNKNKKKIKTSKGDLAYLLFYTKDTNFASVVYINIL